MPTVSITPVSQIRRQKLREGVSSSQGHMSSSKQSRDSNPGSLVSEPEFSTADSGSRNHKLFMKVIFQHKNCYPKTQCFPTSAQAFAKVIRDLRWPAEHRLMNMITENFIKDEIKKSAQRFSSQKNTLDHFIKKRPQNPHVEEASRFSQLNPLMNTQSPSATPAFA